MKTTMNDELKSKFETFWKSNKDWAEPDCTKDIARTIWLCGVAAGMKIAQRAISKTKVN